jgi:hypothetical protein
MKPKRRSGGRRYLAGLWIASLGIAGSAMAGGLCPGLPPVQTKIRFRGHRFELQNPEDLRRLDAVLDGEAEAAAPRIVGP